MSRIFISGALANKPFNGGNAWSRLSWALGFQKLGFEVCFIEQIDPAHCVDQAGTITSFEDSINLAYFNQVLKGFGLSHCSSLIYGAGKKAHGLPLDELAKRAKDTSLLFNISGHLSLPLLTEPIRSKVYYDDDPGFTQIWQATNAGGTRLQGHDFYYSIGQNIGAPDCPIPTAGIAWRHTRPPVVLHDWPVCPAGTFDRFTTVAHWRGPYGPVQWEGKTYGLKVHEFRKLIELPQRKGAKFEIALHIHPNDRRDLEALLAHGWIIKEPKTVAGSPEDFRRYVQSSSAEFSAAQGIYVETNSGWFSDRTVRYLASGRPALVQDTGFSRHVRAGKGLLAFRTADEAWQNAQRIVADYPAHCRAARQVAEEFFDSDKMISQMAQEIGLELP